MRDRVRTVRGAELLYAGAIFEINGKFVRSNERRCAMLNYRKR